MLTPEMMEATLNASRAGWYLQDDDGVPMGVNPTNPDEKIWWYPDRGWVKSKDAEKGEEMPPLCKHSL